VALAGIAALTGAMEPLRAHLSAATPALVLVVPVVAGAAVGGLWSGLVATVAGFLAYDLLYLPPYGTLKVGAAENWVALGVYAAVVLVVGVLVAPMRRAHHAARRRELEARRLYHLSELLLGDSSAPDLLQSIVSTIHNEWGGRWAAVLLSDGDTLSVAALAGGSPSDEELRHISPLPGRPESLRHDPAGVVRLALTARGRPIGLVAIAGAALDTQEDWELLRAYANQAALALERGRLHEQAVRAQLLEQVDRWREALMGAVSHDLRTPLASVKAAVSTLRRPGPALSDLDRQELLELIEHQADVLDRLVANLLDATRLQSGTLELRRDIVSVEEVVEAALGVLNVHDKGVAGFPITDVRVDLPTNLPPVDVDVLLVRQIVVNLLDNALRYESAGGAVEVSARLVGAQVELAVRDHGPGVPEADRERVFEMYSQVGGSGRAGLGLAIAKAFAEAHGQTVTVDEAPGGGARFVLTLPVAALEGATAAAGP
jgi:two-component system sensor histidine kinase KdpD